MSTERPIAPRYACALPFGFWMSTELQAGIDRFASETGKRFHSFWLAPESPLEEQDWVSGMVAFASTREQQERISVLGCPVINVSSNRERHPFPSVLNDGRALGNTAAEHLIHCGARSIAFLQSDKSEAGYRGQRSRGVAEACAKAGIPLEVATVQSAKARNRVKQIEWNDRKYEHWLAGREGPMAVVAASSEVGFFLARAVRKRNWGLGREVALIQLTDARESQFFSDSGISSVPHHWRQVGYRAAEALCRWVEEGEEPIPVEWIPPLPLQLTPSSDPSLSADLTTRVRSLLRHSGDFAISVEEIAGQLEVSISTLYREFSRSEGRKLKDLLVERKINETKRLLLESNLTVEDIAARCGYRSGQALAAVFRKHCGLPPAQWRQRQRDNKNSDRALAEPAPSPRPHGEL